MLQVEQEVCLFIKWSTQRETNLIGAGKGGEPYKPESITGAPHPHGRCPTADRRTSTPNPNTDCLRPAAAAQSSSCRRPAGSSPAHTPSNCSYCLKLHFSKQDAAAWEGAGLLLCKKHVFSYLSLVRAMKLCTLMTKRKLRNCCLLFAGTWENGC